jgi:guanine deaminase
MPGFVDTHVHFPQTRVMGSASGPLLEWLDTAIFPEEGRFKDPRYAQDVAREFCTAMARQGTTAAAVYSSSDAGATDILFQEMADRGLRGLIGLTLMDRNAPDAVLVPHEQALIEARRLIETWHGHDDGRLRFCITPRFAISCTPALLRGAAELAREYDLVMQTHISENRAEIEAVKALFPESDGYLSAYRDHGLLDGHSILAHCIHLTEDEWDEVGVLGACVSHCPDSNFFLGSGVMPLGKAVARDIKWGLGSDVGAGRTFSLRRVAASAFDASKLSGHDTDAQCLLWHATLGGSQVLRQADRVGRIEAGFQADLTAIPLDSSIGSGAALFDALVFRHDSGPVAATYVRGRRVYPT